MIAPNKIKGERERERESIEIWLNSLLSLCLSGISFCSRFVLTALAYKLYDWWWLSPLLAAWSKQPKFKGVLNE